MLAQLHQLYIVLIVCIIVNIYGVPIEKERLVIVPHVPTICEVSSMMYIDRLNTSCLVRQHIQTEDNKCDIYISPLALFAVNQTTFIHNSTTNRTIMIIPLILYTNEQMESIHENNLNECKQNRTECSFHKISIETMSMINEHESEQPNLLDCYNRYIKPISILFNSLQNQNLSYVTFECISNDICLKFEEALHQSNNSIGLYLKYAIQESEEEQMIISDKHLVKTKIHLSDIILADDVENFLEELLYAANIRDNDEYVLSQSDLIQLKKTLRKQFLGQQLILTDENDEKQWNSIYWKKIDIIRPDHVLKLLNKRFKSRRLLKNRIRNDIDTYNNNIDSYVQETYDTEGYDLYLKYRHLFQLQHINDTQRESTSFLKLKPILAYQLNKFNRSRFLVHQPVHMAKRDNIYSIPMRSILPFKRTQSTANRTNNDVRKLEDLQRIINDLQRRLANYEEIEYQSQGTIIMSEVLGTTIVTPEHTDFMYDTTTLELPEALVPETSTSDLLAAAVAFTALYDDDYGYDPHAYIFKRLMEEQQSSTNDSIITDNTLIDATVTTTEDETSEISMMTQMNDVNWITLQNNSIISLESLGDVKGMHWLSGSANGVNLLATNNVFSTSWFIHIHSNEPLTVSFRCVACQNNKVWLTRTHNNEIVLRESKIHEGARWAMNCSATVQSCLLSNANSGEEMYLNGYTGLRTVGLVSAPYKNPFWYTGAYWRVAARV